LLLLLQEADREEIVSEEEVVKALQ
jgi:hypothetical protein